MESAIAPGIVEKFLDSLDRFAHAGHSRLDLPMPLWLRPPRDL
jgi:hypothetical protein